MNNPNSEIIEEFIDEFKINPFDATVGDGWDKIVIYLHKRKLPYKFPKSHKGIPIKVKFIGKITPA